MKPGEVITNDVLRSTFGVGNMGSMRRSLANNVLVIFRITPYEDRWEGNVLHYTGMGTKGSQDITANQNRTLAEAGANGVNIHLFEVFESGKYVYAGEVELVGKPYEEQQLDIEDHPRSVWMFPVRLKTDGVRPIPPTSAIREVQAKKEKELATRPLGLLKKLANRRPTN
jgi:5-methylcytosine-specific restriction protein A